jgi:hypothetical protein
MLVARSEQRHGLPSLKGPPAVARRCWQYALFRTFTVAANLPPPGMSLRLSQSYRAAELPDLPIDP